MKPQTRWEQTTRFLDELPPWQALGSGVVVFFGVSMAVSTLPPWGFAFGTVGITGLVGWLLSGNPLVRVTWQPKPSEPASLPMPTTTPKPDEPVQRTVINEPLEMVELPGGEFWMGSPESEPGRHPDEERHRVRVSSFAMAKVPVTQTLYREVMGVNPSHHIGDDLLAEYQGSDLPAEQVSWFDAVRFCNRLSEQAGLRPCYRIMEPKKAAGEGREDQKTGLPEVEWIQSTNGYRLPTEAEWEYACRAGTATTFSFGDHPTQLAEYAWFDDNSEQRTHEVGTKKPNKWGLHDLHGNVWEWCWDYYDDYRAVSGIVNNPVGPRSGSGRVARGGSLVNEPWFLRSAYRLWVQPEDGVRNVGFRCVRASERQR